MKHLIKSLSLLLTLVVLLTAIALPAAAAPATQESQTYTVTEAQINASYRVTSSPRVRASNTSVNLVPGQAIISSTITPRNRSSYQAVVTLAPRIQNSSVVWDVVSATANGTAATSEQLSQMNSALAASYRRYLSTTINRTTISSVEVTDNEIIYTHTGRSN